MNCINLNIHDVTSLEVQYTPDVQESGTHVRDIIVRADGLEYRIVLFSATADATHPRTEKGETWE